MKQTKRHRSIPWILMLSTSSTSYIISPMRSSLIRKRTPLKMSLDSRELRFYAASSISRSGVKSRVETVSTVDSLDGSMRFTYRTETSLHNNLLTPPGLASLLTSFEKEFFKRQTASFTTSTSALYSSLEENSSTPRSGGKQSIQIDLTPEEQELFTLLRTATMECGMKSTLRVAGGWVRDKILASKEFRLRNVDLNNDGERKHEMYFGDEKEGEMDRITSKFKGEKDLTVTTPVDIDIALDNSLGREFAESLNTYLASHGHPTHSVGVVLKNPEKSKHLETATMRINNYWIDFVNLRAEEYTSDSRIPDLMRIGSAEEDAYRRDLTINSLFYNINKGIVEDMTGRGLDDLKKGVVATPLPPLTTLLDDPLRVLRSVRFAARLRFGMDGGLMEAARDGRVKCALEQKVSRERVGSEVDLMLKSRDPVGAMRLLIDLGLIETVFPLPKEGKKGKKQSKVREDLFEGVFDRGLSLLTTTHDHLCDCKVNPPLWCQAKRALEAGAVNGVGQEETRILMEDEDARRLLWYAAFLKPFRDRTVDPDEERALENRKKPRKSKRSAIVTLLVDELKRPARDADAVDKIMRAADGFTRLVSMGSDVSSLSVLLSDLHIVHRGEKVVCSLNGRTIDPNTESSIIWKHCMWFRQQCAPVLKRIGPLWRAAFILSLCEQVVQAGGSEIEYKIEGDVVHKTNEVALSGILNKYDVFAAAMMNLGLIGIWNQQPLLNGEEIKQSILPRIPKGPAFRDVMDAQTEWMTSHPGGSRDKLVEHLQKKFVDYA